MRNVSSTVDVAAPIVRICGHERVMGRSMIEAVGVRTHQGAERYG